MECLNLCLTRSSTSCRVPEGQQLSDEDAQVRTAFAAALAGLARPLAVHAEQQGWAHPGGEATPAGALPEDLQLRGLLPLEAAHSCLNMQEPAAPQVRLLSDRAGLAGSPTGAPTLLRGVRGAAHASRCSLPWISRQASTFHK